jgi:hypothetical protein
MKGKVNDLNRAIVKSPSVSEIMKQFSDSGALTAAGKQFSGSGVLTAAAMVDSPIREIMKQFSGSGVLTAAAMVDSPIREIMKQFSGSGVLTAAAMVDSPIREIMKQFSRVESERVNQILALSGVFPRVTPTELQVALKATLVGQGVGSDLLALSRSTSTIERESARRMAQIVTAVMFCCWMADLSLSANEVVKVVLQMAGSMALVVPGMNVIRLAGLVFDFLWPPDTDV